MILLHGRGSSPEDILTLADEIGRKDIAYIAPAATGNTWYPVGFLNPVARNEPYLSSALRVISELMAGLGEQAFPPEGVVLAGFSQGACLSLEYAARFAQRFGGVVGLSGGLIGPPGTPRVYPGDFAGTPVFLGCSDVDFHIPKERVHETREVLTGMGAHVTERLYPGLGHTVSPDEVMFVRRMLAALAG